MDLEVDISVRLDTDAATGRATATRRCLGKVRHIAVNELWLQEQVANRKVSIHVIKTKLNLADMLTKYLTVSEIEHIIYFMQHPSLKKEMAWLSPYHSSMTMQTLTVKPSTQSQNKAWAALSVQRFPMTTIFEKRFIQK